MAIVVKRHLDSREQGSEGSPAEVGVLLLHLGGPESLEALETYQLDLWSHPRIAPASGARRSSARGRAQQAFAAVSDELRAGYQRLGGRSPVNELIGHQALALQNRLCERPVMSAEAPGRYRVFPAFCFAEPGIERAVEQAREAGVRRLVALPLYPLETGSTSGLCLEACQQACDQAGLGPISSAIRSFAERPEFLEAAAVRLQRTLDLIPDEFRDRTTVLLSFASEPQEQSPSAGLKRYLAEVEQVAQAVLAQAGLPESRGLVAFQNRGGPGQWLEPATSELAALEIRGGLESLVVFPLGQVTDDFDTLHELDARLLAELHTLGIKKYRRVPVFNADPEFIELLARLVREAS